MPVDFKTDSRGLWELRERPGQVIGLCGYARSGKDATAQFLTEQSWKRLAFADAVRDACYALNPIVGYNLESGYFNYLQEIVDEIGWDRAKVEYYDIRLLLQKMGTEVGRMLLGESVWVDIVARQIEPGVNYVITDVRFPNEVEWLKSMGGTVVRITRPDTEPVNAHVSDTGVSSLPVDVVIENDGTLDDLRDKILGLVYF